MIVEHRGDILGNANSKNKLLTNQKTPQMSPERKIRHIFLSFILSFSISSRDFITTPP